MPSILEPIIAGSVVALINKFFISKMEFHFPCHSSAVTKDHEFDDTSSTSTTVTGEDFVVHGHSLH